MLGLNMMNKMKDLIISIFWIIFKPLRIISSLDCLLLSEKEADSFTGWSVKPLLWYITYKILCISIYTNINYNKMDNCLKI